MGSAGQPVSVAASGHARMWQALAQQPGPRADLQVDDAALLIAGVLQHVVQVDLVQQLAAARLGLLQRGPHCRQRWPAPSQP